MLLFEATDETRSKPIENVLLRAECELLPVRRFITPYPMEYILYAGDILVMDVEGYIFFVDRAGDSFRWHGENVSTGEVENIISTALGRVSCVVYGVEVLRTYKLKKVTYQKEGFNPEEVPDPLFFLDAKQKTYIPLSKELYSDIVTGKVKL
ncbi:hypothetical protein AVEN_164740-1 [Araneus ventricosus]|uniref:Uncharacterized protein n=1 Tax=Araneus ventricosus TaxID=182803 RepID=A0A4Y2HK76_ARAVE|nr:hypothetical protein AVEN_164740-1 [Araneus ventricosus]